MPCQVEAWRPWLVDGVPAGYVTTWAVTADAAAAAAGSGAAAASGGANLTFVTIKDAGHMVPQYQPERALEFFSRWLTGGPF